MLTNKNDASRLFCQYLMLKFSVDKTFIEYFDLLVDIRKISYLTFFIRIIRNASEFFFLNKMSCFQGTS